MSAPIQNPAKCEMRSVIRFLHAKGQRSTDIHKEIVSVYRNIMNRQNGVVISLKVGPMFMTNKEQVSHRDL
ncbi:hypothetical protein TNCV_3555321 [Trichonephila clavipes]|nr:hypothetical protein TNCV_3555321 [Trichonephila clavipes]